MRAAVLRAYGAAPELSEHPDPSPGPAETLVRVAAAPVVPLDLLCATGTSYFGRPPLPYVPGVQGVGTVLGSAGAPGRRESREVPEGDEGLEGRKGREGPEGPDGPEGPEGPEPPEGSRVWFATSAGMAPGDGSLAELCAVRRADVVPITVNVPDAPVAALGTSAIAAWMSLTWRAQVRPGERVVVLGASGAVGQVATALARHLGAARVVAVCRSDSSAQRVRSCGADEVVILDPDEERTALTARLTAAAGGPVDVVVDPVFGQPAAAAAMALGAGGRLVNIGGAAHDVADFSSAVLRGRSIAILGYTNNAISTAQRAEALTRVLELAEQGVVSVEHRAMPLAECDRAWSAAGGSGPRMVVTIS